MAYNPQAANTFVYAGNPNTHQAGNTGTAGGAPPDFCWDVTNNVWYVCTTTGNAAGAVWVADGAALGTAANNAVQLNGSAQYPAVDGSLITSIPQLASVNVFTKAQRGAPVTLTDASTIACDISAANNFEVQLGGNRTLGVPTSFGPGQSGSFQVYQDSTGSRALAYSWCYGFAGGTAPTLTTTALAQDKLSYDVVRAQSATVTITIAAPGVVTYTAHGLKTGDWIQLTTTGALPTGLTASTNYWVIYNDANSFWLATSKANAASGTKITTSGSQSGTQTLTCINIDIAVSKDFMAGFLPPSVTFADHAVDLTSATTYTFTSRALSTAASSRKIVVAIAGYTGTTTVSSVTVGGVSATLVVQKQVNAASANAELWIAAVPTGTTGTVVVTWGAGRTGCGIGLYAVYGINPTASNTATASDAATAASITASLNIPATGVAIAVSTSSQAGGVTQSWTNLTKNYDEQMETGSAGYQSGACAVFATTQTGLNITSTYSSSATYKNMAAASFGPA